MSAPEGLSLLSLGALALVVLTAFTVEAALGFGATLISVALGSMFVSIDALLPSLVPLNLGISLWLVSRYWQQVDVAFLLRRLLPPMALGLPFGIALYQVADASLLKRLFGTFLIVVSALELHRVRSARGADPAPLSRVVEIAMGVAGGIVHGAFATGGPMAVYVTSRAIADKGAYRATLCVLWLALNLVLLVSYGVSHQLDRGALVLTGALVPSCAIGLVLGEIAHHRVPVATFRAAVFVALALAGVMLVVRG
ncbi:sulfite exporter TauE/SafE family protein [Sandaracinus amylolyticus]|uniref:Probable membrane transporter protein n=1 Tax=Sandaracinus amylolyticus TaxID=927083 RepID=A0A0F6SGI8_9BACT|nr:sulfite exporter TauE/SafE family protein [Sandaracinus amylolyticus]AKF08769.1 putative membrane protein [Sandaracinus amylolyticus]